MTETTKPAALAAGDFPAFARALAETDLERLSAQEWSALWRRLQELPGEPEVRVAYLGNFTLDLLPRHVDVACAREGLRAGCYVGGFDQYVQEVLDEDSPLARYRPDVVVLALSLRRLRPGPVAAFAALSAGERRDLGLEVAAHVESWAASAAERLPATLLVANFPLPARPGAGVADLNAEYGETEFHLELNLELLRRFKGNPRVQVLDVERLAGAFGKERATDAKLVYLAKMEWSPAFLPAVAGEVVRHVKAARGLCKKCVVLDLDNTLWGGVVGEEGAAGVKVGPGDPEGEAFADFQHRLKALQARGILLALCSKNNPADALEVFQTRPEMPLRLEDFAALEIGWEPKPQGLARIAEALNVGLDSLVFVDDNPAEVSLVNQMLPAVKTLLLPPDPADFAAALDRLTEFEKTAILEDDAQKTRQYRQNRERHELQLAAGDLATYLASLRTEVTIQRARREDLPRVQQLFAKTNQFNLTTRRYSAAEVERFAASPQAELWVTRARDRFGDLGTIGVALLKREARTLTIDSLLMSCRALGRGIETAMMNLLKRRLLDDPQAADLRARFVPTPKNKPIESYLDEQGFQVIARRDGGETLYVLKRDDARLADCGWMRVVTDELAARR
ncbi:MAG TPA: HAD-IIIC family phosphatase [Thermoanaerobaculia bacterium]|nr:HAD-IIIC family phosphatase [Thermoanaerobaculia bacterium]